MPNRDRAFSRRGKTERLTLLARPGNSGESVIAVELAHDPYNSIDRLEIRSRHRIVHGAVGDQQRLIESAHLQRQEFARVPSRLCDAVTWELSADLAAVRTGGGLSVHCGAATLFDEIALIDFSHLVDVLDPDADTVADHQIG